MKKPTLKACEELVEKMIDNMKYKDLIESYVYFKSKQLFNDFEHFKELKKFYDEMEE